MGAIDEEQADSEEAHQDQRRRWSPAVSELERIRGELRDDGREDEQGNDADRISP